MGTEAMSRLTIHWICPEPTPYHADFFNELHKDPNVSLEVHFMAEGFPGHPWQRKPNMHFPHRIINLRCWFDFHLLLLALEPANKFIVSGWNSPFLIFFILWLTLLRREFLFWADTPNPSKERPMLKRLLLRVVSTLTFRGAHKVLGTGLPGTEAFSAMGCPIDKIMSFPYFAAITDYDPSLKESSLSDHLVVVSVGRLENAVKGFDIGLKALGQVKWSGIPYRFEFLICGSGPDLDRLRHDAEELGLGEDVKFLGWLESDDVTAILKRAHIMLHPAIWEPFGLVILEAMINGVVVVGSEATCAVRDRITHGHNGFVHPVGDVDKIVDQLTALFCDRERLRRMGIAARRSAEEWPLSRGVEIIKSAFRD